MFGLKAQTSTVRNFIFGHSLIDHRPPLYPTPSDETTVPHWVASLADHAGHYYGASGQYGFLPQHANLNPFSQWGYDSVNPVWDSDFETFSEANFNTILITAGNFIQYQAPSEPYYNDPNMTPISATEDISDWLYTQESEMRIFLYENWPDMAGYLGDGSFPPTDSEFQAYNDYLSGAFHDWWIDYHDALIASRPDQDIRMIPVGPILAELFSETLLTQIPVTTLYEDDAPHGRPTVYFLAGLVTYMALYEERAPLDYVVPSIVDSEVADNYTEVVNFMWDALQDFTTADGQSRVFSEDVVLPVDFEYFTVRPLADSVSIEWGVATDATHIRFDIEYSEDGINFQSIANRVPFTPLTRFSYVFAHAKVGQFYFRIKQTDIDGTHLYSQVRTFNRAATETKAIKVFPNPCLSHEIYLTNFREIEGATAIRIYNTLGQLQLIRQLESVPEEGLRIDLGSLSPGVYWIKINQGQASRSLPLIIQRD